MNRPAPGRTLWATGAILVCGSIAHRADAQEAASDSQVAGAIIAEIRVVNGNVFDTNLPEENNWLFRLANRLHIKTRTEVIEQQLLFKRGDAYSPRLVRESERILRANRYFFDAHIVPVSLGDGTVDIEVRTHDVWTFKPGVNFARTGGENTTGFELQESNLLGFGKEVTIARRSSVDRTTSEYRYFDPRVFGSWTRFVGSYASNSDGVRKYAALQRPFYSLDTRWSAQANGLTWDRIDQRYNLGTAIDEYQHREERFDIGGGISSGWESDWIKRLNFGFQYVRHEFAATASPLSAQVLPDDRKLAYPYLGITLLQDNFETRRNQDQIERTEDLYAGTYFQASLGLASSTFGADRRAWVWSVGAGASFEAEAKKHTLVLTGNGSGRIESGDLRNVLGTASATYYWRVADRQLFYASVRGAASEHLDVDRQVTLGGDNGLRGYPLRYQDGTAHAMLTLEHRIYTKYYLFRLFHVGGAVFFDAGRSWGVGNARRVNPNSQLEPESDQGLLTDVGLGLRFGSSRSAFGNVIHVDIAFPLDGDRTIDNVQYIVESKQSF